MQDTHVDTLAAPGAPRSLTYEEFLEWAEGVRAEWVNGQVQVMSAVSDEHAIVSLFLKTLLSEYAALHNLGTVRDEPYQMKLAGGLPGRSPDVFFIARANFRRITPTHLKGPADLVVEVVSAESRTRDRVEKFSEYEQGGVREYWLIDPERRTADFYALGENGQYAPLQVVNGVLRSAVMTGLWLRIEWLWQRPLPSVVKLAREAGWA